MIGEVLYHLHRHIRLVVIVGVLCALTVAGFAAYATAKHFGLI